MVRNEEGALDCLAHALEGKIRQTCTMHDEAYSQSRFGHLINENNASVSINIIAIVILILVGVG